MDILVVGGGGREHAIVKKLKESPNAGKIYCAPGNGGISRDAECVPIAAMDIERMVDFAKSRQVDLVVVAPDDPLVAGMVDAMQAQGITAFGPNARAAIIEGSKVFSKNLMKKYRIPTAHYEVFDSPQEALAYVKAKGQYPTVIKADGLALGKGVMIVQDYADAKNAIHSIMEDKIFGGSGNRVVIEEFITGPEVSVLAFVDGEHICPMVSSMDHKRAFDGDLGPNTGGMGTISPNPYYDEAMAKRCMEEIFRPTVDAMIAEGRPFRGCLYFGLMLTKDGPKVIEYNCRFGDPETQVVLPRLKTDLLEIMLATIRGTLNQMEIAWDNGACACVVIASGGYPGKYEKGLEISGLDERGNADQSIVFHAGTSYHNGKFYTAGGRVLGVTALAPTLEEALDRSYQAVEKITFQGAHYRKDIGKK